MKENKKLTKWIKENSIEAMEAAPEFEVLINRHLGAPDIPRAIRIQAARIWVIAKITIALQDSKESGTLPPDIAIDTRAIKEMKEIALKLCDPTKFEEVI